MFIGSAQVSKENSECCDLAVEIEESESTSLQSESTPVQSETTPVSSEATTVQSEAKSVQSAQSLDQLMKEVSYFCCSSTSQISQPTYSNILVRTQIIYGKG